MKQYSLKIIAIRLETSDTATIVFKQPALKKVQYKAGQYLTLIFRINGRRYIRPYSFSSAPQVDKDLQVTIKRVPGGIVSNHILDQVKVDEIVEALEPLGDFILPEEMPGDTHVVLWGAGSGITPLISIAKYALHQQTATHVTLVYGNRSNESIIFKGQIAVLQEQFPQFAAWHFTTQATISEQNPYLVQGRIDPGKVLDVMQQEADLGKTLHYICGPTGLKDSVKQALAALKVDDSKIFSEDFEVVRNPADFEDIITRTVIINKNGHQTQIEVAKGKSILEAGLDAMLDLNYSCQTGSCGVCKGKLSAGKIKTIGVEKSYETLQPDECLLCSSFPLTDNIEIIVD